MILLSDSQITEALVDLPSWSREEDALKAVWTFSDFTEAFRFLTGVAFLAEKHVHHPEIYNVYNRVELRLSTHDAGDKITQKDIDLAAAISDLQPSYTNASQA